MTALPSAPLAVIQDPTGRSLLGDYLLGFWLPRRNPTWSEGTARYRQWAVNTLLASPLAARPI